MVQTKRTIPLKRKLLFSALVVLFVFLGLECLLRLTGFNVNQSVERMEFTFPIDDYNKSSPQPFLQRDDVLFWKPRADVLGHNSMGVYGPEFSPEKKPGVFRIVCLGDSCTHYGPISYPDMLRAFLDKLAPGQFEVINAGVIGYTSHQGLLMLEHKVLAWKPDLVTVYFGWNDHWLARGLEDKQQAAPEVSGVASAVGSIRLVQVAGLLTSGTQNQEVPKMRVEQADYRNNLRRMIELGREHSFETWMLTAPHAMDRGVPPYLVSSGEIRSASALIPLHQRYTSIVREVAREAKVSLVDFEAQMDSMDKSKLFIEDHIHLSEEGRLYVAQVLLQRLKESGTLKGVEPTAAPAP
ncbi:MAG: SGNH/GDSL hydrolase family protein [Rubripirellula sp.]